MKLISPIRKSDGFTLIELVISIGISAIILVVLAYVFFSGTRTYNTQTAELNVNHFARTALDEIDAQVKQSANVLTSYDTYVTGPSTLVLEVQSVNASNMLIPGVYDTVVIKLVEGKVDRTIYPGAGSVRPAGTKRIAEKVTNLNFEYDNGDYSLVKIITTTITLTEFVVGDSRTVTVSSQAALRN